MDDSFKTGKPLAWAFTCLDKLAPSHIPKSSKEAGKTAAWAADNKLTTYGNLSLRLVEPESTSFIFQAISMAVQQGSVQCVQGAYGESEFEELDEIFYIAQPILTCQHS